MSGEDLAYYLVSGLYLLASVGGILYARHRWADRP